MDCLALVRHPAKVNPATTTVAWPFMLNMAHNSAMVRNRRLFPMTVIQWPNASIEPNRQSQLTDPIVRFVRGEISRRQAMAELGDISYGALSDKVANRGLALPTLPDDELDRMAEDLIRLLDAPA
jgi:hypothetical protein